MAAYRNVMVDSKEHAVIRALGKLRVTSATLRRTDMSSDRLVMRRALVRCQSLLTDPRSADERN